MQIAASAIRVLSALPPQRNSEVGKASCRWNEGKRGPFLRLDSYHPAPLVRPMQCIVMYPFLPETMGDSDSICLRLK